jgi:hypothetical protein
MKYREAKVSLLNPTMATEDRDRFCHELAVLQKHAVRFNRGQVVEDENDNSMFAMAYLFGWKWRQDFLVEVFEGKGFPETEFFEFVHRIVIALNLVPFDCSKSNMTDDFEKAMKGRCSFTRTPKGKYAFAAQIAFESWCKALERKIAHVKS